jgi:hypothetical protein
MLTLNKSASVLLSNVLNSFADEINVVNEQAKPFYENKYYSGDDGKKAIRISVCS